ncbi:MAG TPA: hypothetical protein VGN98_11555, partial [Tianweitania sediminis]|nr:hypothetical protein [Tianweitania sediminis]
MSTMVMGEVRTEGGGQSHPHLATSPSERNKRHARSDTGLHGQGSACRDVKLDLFGFALDIFEPTLHR